MRALCPLKPVARRRKRPYGGNPRPASAWIGGTTLLRQKIPAVSGPRPEEPTQVGSTDLCGRLAPAKAPEGRRGAPGLHGSRRAASLPSLRRLRLLWSSAPHHEVGRVP